MTSVPKNVLLPPLHQLCSTLHDKACLNEPAGDQAKPVAHMIATTTQQHRKCEQKAEHAQP
jgi:hypothetical protein